MTYLGSDEYKVKIRKQIESLNISFTILDHFLDIKEVAAIRKTADIVLNIQTTDALAGSLQSHLYCGNVCIFGNWLRYGVYTDNGIYYIKTTIEDITQHLQDVLRNYPAYKERCKDNHDKIRELFSWEATIKKQAAVYGE
jgi:glycosyltransferase involved in cell wall biosynthesis